MPEQICTSADPAVGALTVTPASDARRETVGDGLDLTAWLAGHPSALHRYFRRRAPASEVDDLVQDVFVRIQSMRRDTPVRDVECYIFTAARHVLIDYHRRLASQGGRCHYFAEGAPEPIDQLSPEHILAAREAWAAALKVILELPPRARVAFWRHRFEDMTYETIAARMGISKESVKELIHRATVRLRGAMTGVA